MRRMRYYVPFVLCLLFFVLAAPRSGTAVAAEASLTEEKLVALTFDDGPRAEVTERILDALERCGGHATFFVVGERVADNWQCLARAEALGCEIGNHTFTHADLTALSPGEARDEVSRCNTVIRSAVGHLPRWLRPPYGFCNETVAAACAMPTAGWNVDPEDWKTRDGPTTVARVRRDLQPGCVVLMHDLYPSTAEAAEVLIPWLAEQGYRMVTLTELQQAGGKVPR